MLVAVTLIGGVLRFARLAYPNALVFDETYYAKDACLYLGKGMTFCGTTQPTEQSYVHPPLGKWIIAMGIKVFGFNTFGWRIMSAVFGTALIVIVFVLARKLLGRWAGGVTGLLVATDFLLIVQSRVALLDIFLAFFVALGFLFVVLERERVLRVRAAGAGGLDLGWRIAAGASFGAAGAVKWSGAYALAAAVVLVVFWTVGAALDIRRAENQWEAHRAPSPLLELNVTWPAMILPAVAVYLCSYGVWFYDHRYSLREFWKLQGDMLKYHLTLHAPHAYASPAWKWPLIWRPVAYYFTGGAKATHILAFGNPATWWPALAAALWLAYRALWRRDSPVRRLGTPLAATGTSFVLWRAPKATPRYLYEVLVTPAAIILCAWVLQYVPWARFSRPEFFFYMTPIVPFMMLALALTLRDVVRGCLKEGVLVAACLAVVLLGAAAVALFVHQFGFGPDLGGQRRIVELAGLPILALGVAVALGYSQAMRVYRQALVGVYLALACGLALFYFYPVIAAWAIPFVQWQRRMLFPTWI